MPSHRRHPATAANAMTPNTPGGMVLRTGTAADAAAVAALHAGQIGEGFLTILGPRFLRRLYRRVAHTPDSFLLVVEDESTAVGFLAGSTNVANLYRSFILRDGAAAAFTCGGRLVRSWSRVLETLRHGTGGASHGAELLAIAVDPAVRRRGVGTLLVKEFLAETVRRRQDAAHVVVAANNESAMALYRQAGFRAAQRFELHRGTESLQMQWNSPSATGCS